MASRAVKILTAIPQDAVLTPARGRKVKINKYED